MIHIDGEKGIIDIEGNRATIFAEIAVVFRAFIQDMRATVGDEKAKFSISHMAHIAFVDDENLKKAQNDFFDYLKKKGN